MWRRVLVVGVAVLLCSFTRVEAGGPYRVVDDEGVIHITDVPSDPRNGAAHGLSGTASASPKAPPGAQRSAAFTQEIRETSERYGVDPGLVEAVIRMESDFNPWAVSPKGAQGLMQLMPRTANALGVRDTFNPRENLEGGIRHLRYLLDRYPGNLPLALAAYNAGEGAVDYYGGVPPYEETRQYVQRVLDRTGNGPRSADPSPPAIYRYEDADGSLTFTNIPRVTAPRGRR